MSKYLANVPAAYAVCGHGVPAFVTIALHPLPVFPMHEQILYKRPSCSRCLRPRRTCICHWITAVDSSTEVLILQHPLEVHQAKGSARLLSLSLIQSRMVTGEVFDEKELHALLYSSFLNCDIAPGSTPVRKPVLLYPTDEQNDFTHISGCASGLPESGPSTQPIRLIVLDGTWRKSRKMLALNPLLQSLPRLSLTKAPASQYAVRKAHRPEQLSTLEATCYALMQLEKDKTKYQPLLHAFQGFVKDQMDYQSGQLRHAKAAENTAPGEHAFDQQSL